MKPPQEIMNALEFFQPGGDATSLEDLVANAKTLWWRMTYPASASDIANALIFYRVESVGQLQQLARSQMVTDPADFEISNYEAAGYVDTEQHSESERASHALLKMAAVAVFSDLDFFSEFKQLMEAAGENLPASFPHHELECCRLRLRVMVHRPKRPISHLEMVVNSRPFVEYSSVFSFY